MSDTTDASAIFAPIWRRKWLILLVGLLAGVGTYLYYRHSTPQYQSTTQVYLGAGAEEQGAAEKGTSKLSSSSVANQVAIINSIVVPSVRQQLRKRGAKARGTAKAKASEKSQFIAITAEAHKARSAALLANEVARAYIDRQKANHQRAIERQLAIATRQLKRIELSISTSGSKGGKRTGGSPQGTSAILQTAALRSKINQLEAQLPIASAQQVNQAKPRGARQVAPKPKQNAIFGFVIGLVLAAIVAYGLAQFDRRLRSLSSIESLMGLQVLSALPRVRNPIIGRASGQLAPSPALLEPLRRLYMTLKLGGTLGDAGKPSPRTLLFISPDPGDGKSTVVADLALVMRESGERVAVIEANLRRPVQARLLGVNGSHGLTDVLERAVAVDAAMQTVHGGEAAFNYAGAPAPAAVTTVVGSNRAGRLSVLTSGHEARNPPALLADEALPELLRSLAGEYDYVLIDAPSPLQVSDVMPLLQATDGIVVVARAGHTQSPSASRLMQLLAHTPSAPVLGLVANCVPRKELARYGFGSPPDGLVARRRPNGR